MTKSVTVNFDDETSHTYDNVPDEVTDDQVQSRAANEFGDKSITGIGGATPTPLNQGMGTSNPELSPGQQAIAAGETALNVANQALQTPLGHAAEAYTGYRAVAKPVIDQYLAAKAAMANPAQAAAPVAQPAPKLSVVNGGMPAASPQTSAMPNRVSYNMPGMGAAPAAAQPPSGTNFMSRMSQLANQYLPVAKTAGKVLGGAAAGYELGKNLFYTNPEEIATMRAAEAQRRAQGWKPLNER